MKLYRILALFRRYFVYSSLEFLRLVDLLYWPVFDIVLWGFTGLWVKNIGSADNVALVLLTCLVFWQVVTRSLMEISMSFLEELWSQNLINLFATPLKPTEWVSAVLLLSITKSAFSLIFGSLVVWLMYGYQIFALGTFIIPYFILLLISGWSLGFIGISILVTAGQRAQSLVWIVSWMLAPFSGVFYPVAVLPYWAQKISYMLPTTYLFEGIRLHFATGTMPTSYWVTSCALSCVYATITAALFLVLFKRSKVQGLARLQID